MFRSSRLSVCLEISEETPRTATARIDQPPANDAMDGGEGAVLHRLPQHLALAVVEMLGRPGLAVQETIRAPGAETDNPVAHDLHADAAIRAASERDPPP